MRCRVPNHLILVLTAGLLCPAVFAQTDLHRIWQDYTGGTAYDVEVSGGWVYVSNNAGVSIYDVREPERPRFVSLLDTGGAIGLSLVGTNLYVAALDEGLLIFDVGDPANPRRIGSYGRGVSDVHVHDGVAYLQLASAGYAGVVDVRDPAHPVELTRIDPIRGAAAAGAHLWIGNPGRGVVHMDIRDPASPTVVGVISGTEAVFSLELRENTLYVAMFSWGTRVYDVSFPSTPRLLFSYPNSGEAYHASGEYPIVCVADLQEGVEILDARLPPAERLLVREDTLAPHKIHCRNRYVHVADQDEGYVLLRLDRRLPPRRPSGRRSPTPAG